MPTAHITVKSEPGKGSTFTVFLPLAQGNESELIVRKRTATNYYLGIQSPDAGTVVRNLPEK